MFLFVTLEKASLEEQFRYRGQFVGPDIFQWQSQNRTVQRSAVGQAIKLHFYAQPGRVGSRDRSCNAKAAGARCSATSIECPVFRIFQHAKCHPEPPWDT